MRRFAHQLPVHQRHQHQNCQQIEGEQRRGDVIGKQTEQRRHDQIAHVGAAHLDADDGLRILCAEMRRGGVDDAGVDGRTAQPHQHKPGKRKDLRTPVSHLEMVWRDTCNSIPNSSCDNPCFFLISINFSLNFIRKIFLSVV